MSITLTEGQAQAEREIMSAIGGKARGNRHLLEGHAGTGKTTLMQAVVRNMVDLGLDVKVSAPTHKAVSVLARKLAEVGLGAVDALTVHALLSLTPDKNAPGEKMEFHRAKHAKPVDCDVVVIDECSMLGADLMRHIRRLLQRQNVLFLGDPAQLPPVGEGESESFATKSRSMLDEIVRQAAGNPIIEAATAIRSGHGKALHPSWCTKRMAKPYGVYLPCDRGDAWLHKAFTSPEAKADPDLYRVVAWTNARVDSVNRKVRRWLYGAAVDDSPFLPGERAMTKGAIVKDDAVLFGSGQEMTVLDIKPGMHTVHASVGMMLPAWSAEIGCWHLEVESDDGAKHKVVACRSFADFEAVQDRMRDEAREDRERWGDLRRLKESLALLTPAYAMTAHMAQGSTFGTVFIDVADILRRARTDADEAQALLYVAVTRASQAAVLLGVRDQAA